MNWRPEFPHVGRVAAAVAVGVVLVMVLSLAIAGVLIGGGSMLFGAGQNCTGGTFTSANGAAAAQPTASAAGRATIPADYLHLYQQAGKKYDPKQQGLSLIYPNPLNTDRYVVINSGHTIHEAEFKGTNALLFPRLGDIAVQKFAKQRDGEFTEETVWADLFNSEWKLDVPKAATANCGEK